VAATTAAICSLMYFPWPLAFIPGGRPPGTPESLATPAPHAPGHPSAAHHRLGLGYRRPGRLKAQRRMTVPGPLCGRAMHDGFLGLIKDVPR
jgi:hypothetical protein